MKHVPPVPRPRGWETRVRRAGARWLAGPGNRHEARPADRFWRPFRPALRAGFGERCGYTAMWIADGTVDHWIPWSDVRGTRQAWRAYDWDNVRYCSPWFNSARRSVPVPDPYVVQDGWFVLRLPSLELEATDQVPAEQRVRVDNALRWLRDDPHVMSQRQSWLKGYRDRKVTLIGLRSFAPLLAEALLRQPEYLNPEDRPAATSP